MREHDYEPVRGLPERPPAGEQILWQGGPAWRLLACHVFHIRVLTAYIGGLWLASAVGTVTGGPVGTAAWVGLGEHFGMAAAALGLVAGLAWLIARTTIYTITNRRVVLRFGIALSKTINLPFALVDGANLHAAPGDLALLLRPANRLAYLVLWPHVRPWRLARSEPMLRALPDAAVAAQVLGRALAATAGQPAQAVRLPVGSTIPAGSAVAA